MTNPENPYSRKYEINFGNGVYSKIAKNADLKKIHGEIWDSLLVRGDPENLILVQRDFKNKKEIIKIHSKEPEAVQSQLEKITGVDLSQYRVH